MGKEKLNSYQNTMKQINEVIKGMGRREQKVIPPMPEYPIFEDIYVYGDVGVGKTYWAENLMNELIGKYDTWRLWKSEFEHRFDISQGKEVIKFFSCSEISVRAKQLSKAPEVLEDLIRPIYIVLDDFFVGNAFSAADVLYAAIEARMRKGKKTLITSNQDLETIGSIEDRLASRIATFKKIHVKGKDRRIGNTEVIEVNNGD